MESNLERVNLIDPAVLLDVVRQDQRSPDYQILDWGIRSLSDKGLANPEGLLLVSGHGQDGRGSSAWSVVLKNFDLSNPVADPHQEGLFFWRRELDLFQSGLLTRLPGPIYAPRCYRTAEEENTGQAWMERIQDTSAARWSLDQFRFAARQLGRMSGACISAGFLPAEPWLCRSHLSYWLDINTRFNQVAGQWTFNPQIHRIFPASTLASALRLLDERELYFQISERLPKVFSHFDIQRRNLMIRPDPNGQDQLVAVDWAFAGIGALGGELVSLVGVNAMLFEIEPASLPELEDAVYPEYLVGLREAGWDRDPDLVRLGYTLWTALWCGAGTPGFASYLGSENGPGIAQFNCQPAEMIAGWAQTCEFALERGEEARLLINKLF